MWIWYKRLLRHGAQVAEAPKPKAPTYFGGQGFTLGDTNAPSVPVQRPAAPQRQGPPVSIILRRERNTHFVAGTKPYNHILEEWV